MVDLTNQLIGEWTVLSRSNRDTGNRHTYWTCKCSCGTVRDVLQSSLTSKSSKHWSRSCGRHAARQSGEKNWRWSGYEEISGTHWNSITHGAKARGHTVEITIEQAWQKFIDQNRKCALSGVSIEFSKSHQKTKTTASLDRIDSSKGYTIANIQWVHKALNMMKQEYSQEEFIRWCKLVALNN